MISREYGTRYDTLLDDPEYTKKSVKLLYARIDQDRELARLPLPRWTHVPFVFTAGDRWNAKMGHVWRISRGVLVEEEI